MQKVFNIIDIFKIIKLLLNLSLLLQKEMKEFPGVLFKTFYNIYYFEFVCKLLLGSAKLSLR